MFKNYFKKKIEKAVNENMEITMLQSMQKLDIKDGDVIVFKHPYKINHQTFENIRCVVNSLLNKFGLNIDVIILEKGMDIGVLRNGE